MRATSWVARRQRPTSKNPAVTGPGYFRPAMERDINAIIRPEPSFAAPRKMLLVRPIRNRWFCLFGLEVFTRFCHASHHEFATQDRIRHDFGLCVPRSTGGCRKAIFYQYHSTSCRCAASRGLCWRAMGKEVRVAHPAVRRLARTERVLRELLLRRGRPCRKASDAASDALGSLGGTERELANVYAESHRFGRARSVL